MQLPHIDYTFTLLTPCFSGTALGKNANHAEMRIPPIRGHLRFWHRALFGLQDCHQVWGSTDGDAAHGSRVALRLKAGQLKSVTKARLLPHADPNSTNEHEKRKAKSEAFALPNNLNYTLTLQRLPACADSDWDHAQRALKTWLLLGGLGLRANRAAGSVWPAENWAPKDKETLQQTLSTLGLRNYAVALIGLDKNMTPDELRATASDTIQGNPDNQIFGSISPRKPSPVKFKVIHLDNQYLLLAVAPNQRTDNKEQKPLLKLAEELLNNKRNPQRWKDIGPWDHILP